MAEEGERRARRNLLGPKKGKTASSAPLTDAGVGVLERHVVVPELRVGADRQHRKERQCL